MGLGVRPEVGIEPRELIRGRPPQGQPHNRFIRVKNPDGVEPAPETRKLARRVQSARKGESHETPPRTALVAKSAPSFS